MSSIFRRFAIWSGALALVGLGSLPAALADEPAGIAVIAATGVATPEETVTRLVLTPASEPVPSLRYRLLPSLIELHKGNAAIHYNKATLLSHSKSLDAIEEKLVAWQEMPFDKLPREEMQTALADWTTLFNQLDMAARRDACDWELPMREQNAFAILLPEIQELRRYSRLLVCKARLEIAEGNFPTALRTLQTGFALARHTAAGPTLINGLVGIAIANQMCVVINDWSQAPGAPNLYWALTSLPQPLIDLRPAMETESAMLYLSYPMLRDLESHAYTTAEWQAFLIRLKHDLDNLGLRGELSNQVAFTALVAKSYPGAKRRLLAKGLDAKKVDAWPVMQVVVLDAMQTYDETRDRMFRWFYVPYAQAADGLDAADEAFKKQSQADEGLPIANLLLPAVNSAYFATVRLERHLAALRIIEAIRMYGAAHGKQLPARLADIREVPIPIDPASGETFVYRLDGASALLAGPRLQHAVLNDRGLRYDIRFSTSPTTNKE